MSVAEASAASLGSTGKRASYRSQDWRWLAVPVLVFLVSRGLILVMSFVGASGLDANYNNVWNYHEDWMREGYPSLWYRWDTRWYIDVVDMGYSFDPNSASSISFFPVYPMLLREATPIFGNPLTAGLVISNVCCLLALIVLYQLTLFETKDKKMAERAIVYIALFPASLFLMAAYTESLFLLLTLIAAYMARRHRWLAAGMAGLVISATRVPGVLITGLIFLEWADMHGWRISHVRQKDAWQHLWQGVRTDTKTLLMIALAPLGLIGYMAYLGVKYGDPFSFIISHSHNATHLSNGPLAAFSLELEGVLNGSNVYPYNFFLGLAALALAVITLIPIARRLRESYAVYTLALILLPAWGGPISSAVRFVGVMFPVFMLLGIWGAAHKWLHITLQVIFIPLLCIFTILYVRWFFVG